MQQKRLDGVRKDASHQSWGGIRYSRTGSPVLAAALRESRNSDQSASEDSPRYSLRRGLSLSSWFRTERPDPNQEGATPTPGMTHSSGETVSPAAELVKAYNQFA